MVAKRVKRGLEVSQQGGREDVGNVLRGDPVLPRPVDIAFRRNAGEAILVAVLGAFLPLVVAVHLVDSSGSSPRGSSVVL